MECKSEFKACLDANVLEVHTGGSKYPLADTHDSTYSDGGFWYHVDVQLPNVECDRCVLQWRYRGGNNWGCDSPNDCGMGKEGFKI